MNAITVQHKFEWSGQRPSGTKKVALLIPQYNEDSCNLINRLEYFKATAREYSDMLDLIIIDDGSSDDSFIKIREFKDRNPGSFYLGQVFPNARKVGALFRTILEIEHQTVILSDFDTDLAGLRGFERSLRNLVQESSVMGYYFRLLPYQGYGIIFQFQQLEYSLQRSLYKFQISESTVSVMPGAGSCFNREILRRIYERHSGYRNGEDRETTLIGLKLGYRAVYEPEILALTRTPPSFRSLIKQRIRWNLGYLETVYHEYEFYQTQVKTSTHFGMRTIADVFGISINWMILLFIILSLTFKSAVIYVGIAWYFVWSAYCLNLIAIAPNESNEFKRNRLFYVLVFPPIKVVLDTLSWGGAIARFIQNCVSRKYKRSKHTMTVES